jgi:predicted ribosome quality control (RQC) complex YloA/Tae2 family protein
MAERDGRRGEREVGETDADAGIWRGQSVARRFVSPDGLTILVGRSAADNDVLTFKLGSARDFWMHVASESGSHVIVRNPENLRRLPRETQRLAASLAAGHSRARHGGRVPVHVARCADVSKPRGFAPGKVLLARYETVQAMPLREPVGGGGEAAGPER